MAAPSLNGFGQAPRPPVYPRLLNAGNRVDGKRGRLFGAWVPCIGDARLLERCVGAWVAVKVQAD